MRNSIHEDATMLEGKDKNGVGWKIFTIVRYGDNKVDYLNIQDYGHLIGYTKKDDVEDSTIAVFDKCFLSSCHDEDGFSFYFDRETAERICKLFSKSRVIKNPHNKFEVRKIKYIDGICEQNDNKYMGPPTKEGLCKSFRIIERNGSFGGIKFVDFVKKKPF